MIPKIIKMILKISKYLLNASKMISEKTFPNAQLVNMNNADRKIFVLFRSKIICSNLNARYISE